MGNVMWTRQQDQRCVDSIQALREELTGQLNALSTVVSEFTAELTEIREQMAARTKVVDDDLSAMESRVTTRLEELEDRLPGGEGGKDYSTVDKAVEPMGGFKKWTTRKREAELSQRDPSVFTRPRTKQAVATETPKEE